TFRVSLASFNDMNAQVLGVCVDSPFSNAAFAERNALTFPLLSDYGRTATRAYDVALDNFAGMEGYTASKRAVFVLDKEGVIRYAWVGPNPGVEPSYDEVPQAVRS